MHSRKPKPLQSIAGRASILHVLAATNGLEPDRVIVVHGPNADALKEAVTAGAPQAEFALQPEPRGTGDAAQTGLQALGTFGGPVLVLCADVPLISTDTLATVHERITHADQPDLVVLGFRPEEPAGYGRLLLNGDGQLQAIVEDRDASADLRASNLCNSGIIAADARVLRTLLPQVEPANAAGELQLTDTVALAAAAGQTMAWIEGPAEELLGINTRRELAACEAVAQARLRHAALEAGAYLVDPATTWLCWDTQLAPDVRIEPQVYFGPGVRVGEGSEIRAFCHLEGADIGQHCRVGPFARLRPGTRLEDGARVGNFVEVKNAVIGAGAKASHLAYIGDGSVGAAANIGAGTIFCNFDGAEKHRTEIGADAFIGSNTALVAPVRVGRGAVIGAGSTITEDVPDSSLAVERSTTQITPVRPRRHASQRSG